MLCIWEMRRLEGRLNGSFFINVNESKNMINIKFFIWELIKGVIIKGIKVYFIREIKNNKSNIK